MTFGLLQQCVGCPRDDECVAEGRCIGKKRKKTAYTFTVEEHDFVNVLCAVDGNGRVRRLGTLDTNEDVDIFNETLALAKAAAHAHGVNGI